MPGLYTFTPMWIECVPNISDGRRPEVIDAVVRAIRSVPGVVYLSTESDRDHNRSVLTFAGPPGPVAEAAFRCAQEAALHIDLTEHEGQHPRMGATDVVPFVPLGGATMEDCVALANRVGDRIARELHIPVFLYGKAATRPERVILANVRKGQFEGLREQIGKDPARDPDFGPKAIHPTAGATAVGARFFLVAYNVNLKTTDLALAKEIAVAVREKDGGFPGVQAMGFALKEKGCVQVSMNLLDYRRTGVAKVYAEIERRARERGVEILESELVGMIPREAVDLCFQEGTRCLNFQPGMVIETRIEQSRSALDAPREFVEALASRDPVPGGGSAAALAGSMGAALVAMMANLTIGRKKYADVEGRMSAIRARAEELKEELFGLIRKDTEAYGRVMEAYKLPKEEPGRASAIAEGLKGAAQPPLRMAELCAEAAELAAEAIRIGNTNAVTDCGGGSIFAEAACVLAADNVRVNLRDIPDPHFVHAMRTRVVAALAKAHAAARQARQAVDEALGA